MADYKFYVTYEYKPNNKATTWLGAGTWYHSDKPSPSTSEIRNWLEQHHRGNCLGVRSIVVKKY